MALHTRKHFPLRCTRRLRGWSWNVLRDLRLPVALPQEPSEEERWPQRACVPSSRSRKSPTPRTQTKLRVTTSRLFASDLPSAQAHAAGFFSSGEVRPVRRASSHPAASVSFSETSRRNVAVRFSVSGARSFSTNFRSRVNSASSFWRISSNLSIDVFPQSFLAQGLQVQTLKPACNFFASGPVSTGPETGLRSTRTNSGIIGTPSAARKEADCPFPINGSSGLIVGETPRADFSAVAAVTISRARNCALLATP